MATQNRSKTPVPFAGYSPAAWRRIRVWLGEYREQLAGHTLEEIHEAAKKARVPSRREALEEMARIMHIHIRPVQDGAQ